MVVCCAQRSLNTWQSKVICHFEGTFYWFWSIDFISIKGQVHNTFGKKLSWLCQIHKHKIAGSKRRKALKVEVNSRLCINRTEFYLEHGNEWEEFLDCVLFYFTSLRKTYSIFFSLDGWCVLIGNCVVVQKRWKKRERKAIIKKMKGKDKWGEKHNKFNLAN